MASIRTIGLASALLLLLPAAAYALPNYLWPDPNDPSSLVVQGGAEEIANVSDIALVDLPGQYVVDPNSTFGTERLVEGHTVFATITIEKNPVPQANGSVDVSAIVNCTAQAGWDGPLLFGIPLPQHVHRTFVDCVQNATLVAIPDPLDSQMSMSSLVPDGVVLRYATPNGAVGYETEYSYHVTYRDASGVVRETTRYAWGTSPIAPFPGSHGEMKNLYLTLPLDKLVQMQQRSFHVVDARTLDVASS